MSQETTTITVVMNHTDEVIARLEGYAMPSVGYVLHVDGVRYLVDEVEIVYATRSDGWIKQSGVIARVRRR